VMFQHGGPFGFRGVGRQDGFHTDSPKCVRDLFVGQPSFVQPLQILLPQPGDVRQGSVSLRLSTLWTAAFSSTMLNS
jgi:hypothetical protein